MTGCLYELDGEVKAYPNIDRLKKKFPNAKIIKEIENVNTIDQELLKYKGIEIKEKPRADGLRECSFKYRVNRNTILEAYTEEDLNKLKSWWNVKEK